MPFQLPPNEAVLTTDYVTEGGLAVLQVSHQHDEEEECSVWQFHCGNGDYAMERMQLVALATLLRTDPSLEGAAELPVGWTAYRDARDAPWRFVKDDG